MIKQTRHFKCIIKVATMKLCQLWFMFEIVIIKCCGGNHVTSGSWQGQIAPIEPAFSQIKHIISGKQL